MAVIIWIIKGTAGYRQGGGGYFMIYDEYGILQGSELPHGDKWCHIAISFLLLFRVVLHQSIHMSKDDPHDHTQQKDDIYERLVSKKSHSISNGHD